MQTITTSEIRDAIVAKLLAIVPTFEDRRAIGWSYHPSPRKGGRVLLPTGVRNFDLSFGPAQPLYRTNPAASWAGGGGDACAYGCRLVIAVSYADVEPASLEHMLVADAVDLHLALRQLRDPTLPGFSNAEPGGIANDAGDDEANAYAEHVFTIHWNQATTPSTP